ncbi:MAG: DUF1080 domain-containing protein [Verrucomicrobia bacterium]|nr:DUF1080 domain-containing protein [Verrucomicrobiota bacterium]
MLLKRLLLFSVLLMAFLSYSRAANEPGFISLFDGKTLTGWNLVNQHGGGYGVTNGILYCARGGGGNLFTEKEYANFIFRFDFRLEPGSNNGIGIRAPLEGDAAFQGMEIQVLDDTTKKYGPLQPEQLHGSIYGVAAAKTGAQKPLGEWNSQEIIVNGRQVKVVLNGKTILDADLSKITDPAILKKHPGLLRDRGYIGFLGHGDFVEFRNIRIKPLPETKTQ